MSEQKISKKQLAATLRIASGTVNFVPAAFLRKLLLDAADALDSPAKAPDTRLQSEIDRLARENGWLKKGLLNIATGGARYPIGEAARLLAEIDPARDQTPAPEASTAP